MCGCFRDFILSQLFVSAVFLSFFNLFLLFSPLYDPDTRLLFCCDYVVNFPNFVDLCVFSFHLSFACLQAFDFYDVQLQRYHCHILHNLLLEVESNLSPGLFTSSLFLLFALCIPFSLLWLLQNFWFKSPCCLLTSCPPYFVAEDGADAPAHRGSCSIYEKAFLLFGFHLLRCAVPLCSPSVLTPPPRPRVFAMHLSLPVLVQFLALFPSSPLPFCMGFLPVMIRS